MATLQDLALKIIIGAEDQTSPAFRSVKDGTREIESSLQRLENVAKRFLSITLFAGWAEQTIALSDAYKTLQSRLKLVSDNTQEFTRANRELFDIAQRTRTPLEATASLYGKVETAVKQLGGTQQQSISITETLNQAIALTSMSASQNAAAILQFNQALGSGVLRGDEFNSVMENSPGLAQALADGLGVPTTALRAMAEQGQLTADKLIDALGKSAPRVAEQFAQLPETIAGSFTKLQNSLLRYVGESNQASTATRTLSGAVDILANNLEPVADIALTLAEIWTVRVVQGLVKSGQAIAENTRLAGEKAAADLRAKEAALTNLQTQAQLTAVREKATSSAVRQAQAELEASRVGLDSARAKAGALAGQALAQEKLAQGSAAAVAAQTKLKEAEDAVTAATSRETAAQKTLQTALAGNTKASAAATAAQAKLQAAMGIGIPQVSALEKGLGLLNTTIGRLASVAIGVSVFDMLLGGLGEHNEKIRLFSFAFKSVIESIMVVAAHLFSGDFLTPGAESLESKLEKVRLKYGDMAMATTDAARRAEEHSQATEQAQSKIKEALKVTEERMKEGGKIAEDVHQREIALLDQALAARLTAINASSAAENVKNQQTTEATLAAETRKIQLIQQYGAQRLALVDAFQQSETAKAAQGEEAKKQIEQTAIEGRKAAYQSLAGEYSRVVDALQGQYAREMQAFNQSNQTLRDLALSHEQALLAIKRGGMTEKEVLQSKELERDGVLEKLRKEAAKGERADQDLINKLYTRAEGLIGNITAAKQAKAKNSIDKNSAEREGERLLNEAYGLQQGVVEKIGKQHKTNADILLPSLETAKGKLSEVNTALGDMDKQLATSKKLNLELFGVDQVRSQLNALLATETKTIIVQMVNAGGASPVSTADIPGKRWGGIVRFMASGGRLPGYGGGDRRLLMAEDGEFVVNKESTKAALPLLEAINKGDFKLPGFASGGLVDSAFEQAFSKRLDDKIVTLSNLGFAATTGQGDASDWQKMDQVIRDIRTAVARAPSSLRSKLEEAAAAKLEALLGQVESSRDYAADNAADPLSTLQNSPGLLQKLEDKVRYLQRAINRFGGQSLGGAYLGGFAPFNQATGRDMKFASPNFRLPNIGRMVDNAMAPMNAAMSSQTMPAPTKSQLGSGEIVEINVNWGKRTKLYADKSNKSDVLEMFKALDESKRSAQ